jgi:hypothetical protein
MLLDEDEGWGHNSMDRASGRENSINGSPNLRTSHASGVVTCQDRHKNTDNNVTHDVSCATENLVKSFFDIVTSLLKFEGIYRNEVTREKEDRKFVSSYSRRNRGYRLKTRADA